MEPKALEYLKSLLKDQNYEAVLAQFDGEKLTAELLAISSDMIKDIILPNLQDYTYHNEPKLYACAESLLRLLVVQAPSEELMLEIMEFMKNRNSKHVFNTALNALQVLLLHFGDRKVHEFEYALNSIKFHLDQMPKYPKVDNDAEEQMFLERFIAIESFYEPILKEVLGQKRDTVDSFLNVNLSRRNLLLFFFIRLLDKPLALLNLKTDKGQRIMEVRRKLTAAATDCLGNPFLLLNIVERRTRFRPMLKIDDYSPDCQNYFLIEDKLPLRAIAIYFYMLLVEEVSLRAVPLVYSPQFVLDTALYLCVELFKQKEPEMRNYGLKFAWCLLGRLNGTELSHDALYLEVHRDFVYNLCEIIDECSSVDTFREVLSLLTKYIRQYKDEVKGLIIRNMLRITVHEDIQDSLTVIYVDLITQLLNSCNSGELPRLPACFSGECFRVIMLEFFFHLPKGAKTDLFEEVDRIWPSLTFLMYLCAEDQGNLTGFWDIYEEIKENYLLPIKKALGTFDLVESSEQFKQLEILNAKVLKKLFNQFNSPLQPSGEHTEDPQSQLGLQTPSVTVPLLFPDFSIKIIIKNILEEESPNLVSEDRIKQFTFDLIRFSFHHAERCCESAVQNRTN